MGQQEVADVLKAHYPDWITRKNISTELNVNKQTVFRNLRKLKKRNDIQVKVVESKQLTVEWETLYRINMED
jgi:DNA-binding transcriptional regulator LsrR (DeoR family)